MGRRGRSGGPGGGVGGGGVGGAAAALGMAQQGLSVKLVEPRRPPPWDATSAPDLRVYAISPASQSLFEHLGVWSAIQSRRAQAYRHMEVWDAVAGRPMRLSAQEDGREVLGHIVESRLILDALWAALEGSDVRQRLGASAVALSVDSDSLLRRLQLSDGETITTRLVVSAEGANSPLRRAQGIATQGRDYAQQGMVCFVETESDHADTAWQRFLPTGPLAFLPFGERRCSIVWTLPTPEATRVCRLPPAAFESELERAFDTRLGRIRLCSERVGFPLRMQLAERMVEGPLVLMGDAAHAVHPLAGQGVNLGLADVSEWLACVAAARTQQVAVAGSRGLARSARRRRSDRWWAAQTFDAIERIYSAPQLVPSLLRGHAFSLVSASAWLRRQVIGHASGQFPRVKNPSHGMTCTL